jgi:hypothetical protein
MAYGVVPRFTGGTKGQYEASLAAVHPNGGKNLPEGQIFHAAGPSQGGWTIVAIHDSRESWERLRDDTLMPRLQGRIEGGFTRPLRRQRSRSRTSRPPKRCRRPNARPQRGAVK